MKAERRHELQTNALADWLGQAVQRYREYLPTAATAALAIAAAFILGSVWFTRGRQSDAQAWEEHYFASQVGDAGAVAVRLKQIAAKYPGTDVALWAQLDMADAYVLEGRRKLDIDRDSALARLREAQQTYESVMRANPRPEMVRRAALAEAKCWELLGDREEAIAAYRAFAENYSTKYPELAAEAASRASDLEQPEAADFYKWLAEYKPPQPTLPVPSLPDATKPATNGTDKSSTPGDSSSPPSSEPSKQPADEKAGEKTGDPSKPEAASSGAAAPEKSGATPPAEKSQPPGETSPADPEKNQAVPKDSDAKPQAQSPPAESSQNSKPQPAESIGSPSQQSPDPA